MNLAAPPPIRSYQPASYATKVGATPTRGQGTLTYDPDHPTGPHGHAYGDLPYQREADSRTARRGRTGQATTRRDVTSDLTYSIGGQPLIYGEQTTPTIFDQYGRSIGTEGPTTSEEFDRYRIASLNPNMGTDLLADFSSWQDSELAGDPSFEEYAAFRNVERENTNLLGASSSAFDELSARAQGLESTIGGLQQQLDDMRNNPQGNQGLDILMALLNNQGNDEDSYSSYGRGYYF